MIDISWPIEHGTTTEYKDRETLAIELRARHEDQAMEESVICMGTHTGTHIDAPAHFIKGGKTLSMFSLEAFYGSCQVLDLTKCSEVITLKDIEGHVIEPDTIILLKTTNSSLPSTGPFYPEFIYLSAEAAEYLANKKVKAVGIDYLSIERNQPDHPTHKALLSKDILIIEGLRLAPISEGSYLLSCFPLKLIATEASPARAVLMEV